MFRNLKIVSFGLSEEFYYLKISFLTFKTLTIMKKVLSLYLSKLRNAEYYQAISVLMNCFTTELKTKYKFDGLYNELNDSKVRIDVLFNKNRKAEETPEVKAADKARDAVFVGVKQLIQGFLHAGDPGQKAAAEKIQFVLKPYKSANSTGYEANSGSIHKFLVDVKKNDVYNYVTKLNINHQIDELAALNDAFDEIYYKRADSYLASEKIGKLGEIRKAMDTAYRNLIEKVNALYLIADDDNISQTKDDIGELIDHLNAIILQTSRTISRRRGVKIIVEDDNGDGNGNDGDSPIEI